MNSTVPLKNRDISISPFAYSRVTISMLDKLKQLQSATFYLISLSNGYSIFKLRYSLYFLSMSCMFGLSRRGNFSHILLAPSHAISLHLLGMTWALCYFCKTSIFIMGDSIIQHKSALYYTEGLSVF